MSDTEHASHSHWIPLADLMTGLMMVFMLLTAAFMLRVEQTTTLVVKEFEETKAQMLMALQQEFAKDLKQWNAELLGDMTIRFGDSNAQFLTGRSDLQPKFRATLAEFFPRYVGVLSSERFRNSVKEIRIEGHTSAFWAGTSDPQSAYFQNMRLSQDRTRSALEFVLQLPQIKAEAGWLKQHLTANGLSSSRPVNSADPNSIGNQRVEFRIVTNAESRMQQIAEELQRK